MDVGAVPPVVVEAGAVFFTGFLVVFLLVVFEVLLAELLAAGVLLLAGGFCAAGVACAKATVEATAKAIAIKLFFICSILPAGLFSSRLTIP